MFGQTAADGTTPIPVRVVAAAAAAEHGGAASTSSTTSTTADSAELRHKVAVLERHAKEQQQKSMMDKQSLDALLKQLAEETTKAAKCPNLEHQLERARARSKELEQKLVDTGIQVENFEVIGTSQEQMAVASTSNLDQKQNESKVQQRGSGNGDGKWKLKIQLLQQKLDVAENQLRVSRMISSTGNNNSSSSSSSMNAAAGGAGTGAPAAAATTTTSTTSTTTARINVPHGQSGGGGYARASRDDWRRFAEEKRDMTKRYNMDRAALAAENHRMRLALAHTTPRRTEESEKEKYIVRLQSELSSERMLKKAGEQEISSLAKQLLRLNGNSALLSSAQKRGETTLSKQLRETQRELERVQEQMRSSGVDLNWKVERGQLMENWNEEVAILVKLLETEKNKR